METGAAILLCAHPSARGRTTGSGESGSTGWNNGVRSRLYLKKKKSADATNQMTDMPDKPEDRILSRMKANYAPTDGDDISLFWNDGVFDAAGPVDPVQVERRGEYVETMFMNVFDQLIEEGVTLAESNKSPNNAPKVILKRFPELGCTQEELERAMQMLINGGLIRVEQKGPPSQQKQYLIRTSGKDQGNEAA
jgi:hypothetical protein